MAKPAATKALIHHKKSLDKIKKKTSLKIEPTNSATMAGAQPPRHIANGKWIMKNVVYITNSVWAVVDRNVGEDLARNRLHPGTQSDVDGERQRLEPFKNALGNLGRRALHIEQIWRRSGLKPRSNRRTKKSADRQTAFRLYIVD